MKRFLRLLLAGAAFALTTLTASAQTTAFTYQGFLTDQGAPANGTYDLTFTVFDAASVGAVVGVSNVVNAAGVTNGLFTVTLDFGAASFNGAERWLEIAVRPGASVGDYTNLAPRHRITATPYALRALSFGGTISNAQFAGTYTSPVTISNPANAFYGSFIGDGTKLTNLSSDNLTGSVPSSLLSNAWRLGGNAGTLVANHFLGTTDNQPLEVRVGNARALRLVPDTSSASAPNLIGGAAVNTASAGIIGAVIAGGGSANYEGNGPAPNTVSSNYGTVAGGAGNDVASFGGFIGGGFNNSNTGFFATVAGGALNLASNNHAFVGGGLANRATGAAGAVAGGQSNRASGAHSFIGGGSNVQALGSFATVAGGRDNLALVSFSFVGGGVSNAANSSYATVAGGQQNTASGSSSTVAGGIGNQSGGGAAFIGGGNGNQANGVWATIGGGLQNIASANNATIGGGEGNDVTAVHAFIGGGLDNRARSPMATVGGGRFNTATNAASTVAGGAFNSANGFASTVGGGTNNIIDGTASTIAGGRAGQITGSYGFIGGGSNNLILDDLAVVGGGRNNDAWGSRSFVGGGSGNRVYDTAGAIGGGLANASRGLASVVAGGSNNLAHGDFSFVGGGRENDATNQYAAVAGGVSNRATAFGAFVGGGFRNTAIASSAVVGGGELNDAETVFSTIGGGSQNETSGDYATVGGGRLNIASGFHATVPGGYANWAVGNYSFAAGYLAHADDHNTFVWADGQAGSFGSTGQDQFLIRASGGVGIGLNNPAAPLHVVGGADVTLASGGHLILGSVSGANLAVDNNEIQVRNNGAATTLFLNAGGGRVSIGTTSSTDPLRVISATCDGTTWNNASDRNLKAGFQSVDASDVLAKVAALPIQTWHYTNAPGTRHIGAMAQDFHAAFDVGSDDKLIATVDADGVALAAIQGLNQKLADELKRRDRENAEMKQELAELKRMLAKLLAKGN